MGRHHQPKASDSIRHHCNPSSSTSSFIQLPRATAAKRFEGFAHKSPGRCPEVSSTTSNCPQPFDSTISTTSRRQHPPVSTLEGTCSISPSTIDTSVLTSSTGTHGRQLPSTTATHPPTRPQRLVDGDFRILHPQTLNNHISETASNWKAKLIIQQPLGSLYRLPSSRPSI